MKVSLVAVTTCAVIILGSAAVSAATRRRAVVQPSISTVIVTDDFRNGPLGWQAGFADYSPLSEPTMELASGIRALPAELGVQGTGFFIQAHNRSDDVFMFLKKKLTRADGIQPNQLYEVSYEMAIGSQAGGENCAGIGGHPGFSVYLKAGAASVEPLSALAADNHYRMNVDIGQQSQGGSAASVAGNISTGASDCQSTAPFRTITRSHRHPVPVMSNRAGEIWLLVGTDSGFEGLTRLYYQSIKATLIPR
jgi:hypothetical protein